MKKKHAAKKSSRRSRMMGPEMQSHPIGSIVVEVDFPSSIKGLSMAETKLVTNAVKEDPTAILGQDAFVIHKAGKGVLPIHILGSVVGVCCAVDRDDVKLFVMIDKRFEKSWSQDKYLLHGIRNPGNITDLSVSEIEGFNPSDVSDFSSGDLSDLS